MLIIGICSPKCDAESDNAINGVPEIVKPFRKLFDINVKLGTIKGFVHKVKVKPDIQPIQQKLRRLPFAVREKVSDQLKKLENEGIIEKIDASDWISPIVVAWKKSGDVRVCVDLREVNKSISPDKFPLPKIDELLSEIGDAKMYSQLDLTQAYHQLLLHPDSRNLTAFITHDGVFQYKRVCFGLSSAPSVFQKMMSTILAGLKGVQCYLDDVIIWGCTQIEHDENLKAVLTRLSKYDVKLNLGKCQFSKTEIQFLGHTLSDRGIQVGDKHRGITQASVPTDDKSLRSLLGLASYFSKYIPNMTNVLEPMRRILRSSDKFRWTDEAQRSFVELKGLLTQKQVLASFNANLDIIVTTDASGYGLGAVMTQIKDGVERTIECISRTLSINEQKYSTSEKEALACVWACERWNTYLWGRKFTLRTDHQALVTLLSAKGSDRQSLRISRWACRLLKYNYTMQFKKGSENTVADALSRIPMCATENEIDVQDEIICHLALGYECQYITLDKLKEEVLNDKAFNILTEYIQNKWPEYNNVEDCVKPFYRFKDELCVCDQIIMRNDKVLIPQVLKKLLLELAHENHQGMTRTKQLLRMIYWWPGMDKQVEDLIKACLVCQFNDKSVKQTHAPLQPVKFPERPWEKVAIDIVGPFERATNDCRYAITLVDYNSKWPEVGFTSKVTTSNVIDFLKTVFSREGFPWEIVSDNGTQFVSEEFRIFLSERGIKHTLISLYYPESNGAVERFNGVLKNCIQNCIITGKQWKMSVREFLAAYRATPHATTGQSPAAALHGRELRTKLDIRGIAELQSKFRQESNLDDPVLKSKQSTIEKVQQKQDYYKNYVDNIPKFLWHQNFYTGIGPL